MPSKMPTKTARERWAIENAHEPTRYAFEAVDSPILLIVPTEEDHPATLTQPQYGLLEQTANVIDQYCSTIAELRDAVRTRYVLVWNGIGQAGLRSIEKALARLDEARGGGGRKFCTDGKP